MPATDKTDRLVASPCCNPDLRTDEALAAYSQLGMKKFEVFTSWAKSAFDIDADPSQYIDLARLYGMSFTSFHLPAVTDGPATVDRALDALRFAKAIGAGIVLYKADSRPNYARAAHTVLDQAESLGLTCVLQNHAGTAISSLDDFAEVIGAIDDPRMKTLLEVGHFHTAGVNWRDGCKLLGSSIALVHVKDQIGAQSVPYGSGEIDLIGLFEHLRAMGYEGNFVVEMELADPTRTLDCLAEAVDYLVERCL